VEKIESHGPDQGGVLAEFRLNIQSLAEDFRKLARNRTNDEREHIFAWHIARPYTQFYLAGGWRYVQEVAYPRLRRLPGWDELRWSRHVQHIRALAAYAWMRDAAIELPFALKPFVTRSEFVEDLEFQFLESLEKPEPPALQMVPAEAPSRPGSPPSEPAPTNADQGPKLQETSSGVPSASSPESPEASSRRPSEASREEPPEASWCGSIEPDLSTPKGRRSFVNQFRAEYKRLFDHKVTMGDIALLAGHKTRSRRFAVYEWIRRGGEDGVCRVLMAGPANAAESLKDPSIERRRAMTRSAKAAPKM
jgi:hypothetical protein